MRVDAYDLQTGNRLGRVPNVTNVSWSHSWNDKGSMNVTVTVSNETQNMDLDSMLLEQKTILALRDGNRILHAGPILTSPEWDPTSASVKISCGGGWDILSWRLVLDTRLIDRIVDGELLIDEDNPGYEWRVGYGGSGGDIIRSLITLAKAWGPLPITPPTGYGQPVGTPLSGQWDGWDFTTIAQAISNILDMENGGQVRFDPELLTDGRLQWRCRWQTNGIVDHTWQWNTSLPDQHVIFTGLAPGNNPIINEIWVSGGRDDDRLMLYRANDPTTRQAGWPLLQSTISSLPSGSLAQLHAGAHNALVASRRDRTWKLKASTQYAVTVGDHINLRVNDPYIHDIDARGNPTSTLIPLVVTDVSGSTDSEWLDIQARQRASSINGIRPGTSDPMRLVSRGLQHMNTNIQQALTPSASRVYQTTAKLRALLRNNNKETS